MKPLILPFLLVQLVADDALKDRPAFSLGDQAAQTSAQCDNIRKMSAGLGRPEYRIDLTITGELTTVRSDGALWYLLMCREVRVLCVTYESNDMKAGDRVIMKGGYNRLDDNHVMLDPCLANSP
ncbi:MAG: hypothetical protein K2Z80_04310 [Xanthobacteraceae bacterium]|nr:hypothetical protein [Xanthobacteraceae bacterium]